MISPTRFLEMYIAMSLHFKEGSTYDFIAYRGSARVTEESLQKRKDKYFFEKLSRKMSGEDDAVAYLASNFINGNNYIVKLDDKYYKEFLAYADAIEYRFEKDLERYQKEDPIEVCYSGSTEPFTYLIILNECSNGAVFKLYDEKYGSNDILWSDLRDNKLKKYAPFIQAYYNLNTPMKRLLCEKVKSQVA